MTISVLWSFLTVSWVGLKCLIVVFPDHAHLPSYGKMDHLMCITTFQPSLKTSRMVSLVFIIDYSDITILTNLSLPDVLMFRTNLKSAPSKESKDFNPF